MKSDTQDIFLITNNEYCRTHKTIFTFLQEIFYLLLVIGMYMSTNKAIWLALNCCKKIGDRINYPLFSITDNGLESHISRMRYP